jgi:hypothetical protein
VVDAAVDGQRLVVLVNEDPGWALSVSDDLGTTVRRFALGEPFNTDGRALALHLFRGRVFVLAEFADLSLPYSNWAAHVFEVDPVRGGIAQRGGDVTMSGASGYAAPDGSYTTVGYARDRLPQVVAVTRFNPETNRVSRVELPCTDDACQVGGAGFISSDGDLFNALTGVVASSARCMVTAHAATHALETECSVALAGDYGTPLRAFGSTSYDFEFVAPDGALEPDAPWSLVPVVRNWLSAGPPISFAPGQLLPFEHGFFAFSPSAFATDGDDVLVRLQPSGLLEQSTLVHDGCLSFSVGRSMTQSCSFIVRVLPLAGAEVLYISRRDEFHDDDHSRWVFDIGRSNTPFTAFQTH